MKAAVRSEYGTAEVLSIQEVAKPTPKDNEILVRVYAATANRTDCHLLWGKPFFMKLLAGFPRPRLRTTGTDFAGQVEAVGKNVTAFKPGDKAIGFNFMGLQSHAQYLTVSEDKAITYENNITYEQAVACVEGAFYALSVINKIKPAAGQKAMVLGATGAIGSSALQFLNFHSISVTATCRAEHGELLKSIGAEKIIDYKTEDFTKLNDQYDFIFDAVGKYSFSQCKPVLKKKGIYSSSGGAHLFLSLITPLLGGKRVVFAPPKNLQESLRYILDLVAKGKFQPVIDRTYPLDKIAEAFTYVGTGEKVGNVIIATNE